MHHGEALTFFSNFIYRVVEGGDDERVADLSLDRHGASDLAAWAERAGIDQSQLHWVDSCWLKVRAGPDDVARYLDEFADPGTARRLKADLEPNCSYEIMAEEF
jgi:hypothetical protein